MQIIRDYDLDCRGHEFIHPVNNPEYVACRRCASLQTQAVFCILGCEAIRAIQDSAGSSRRYRERLERLFNEEFEDA